MLIFCMFAICSAFVPNGLVESTLIIARMFRIYRPNVLCRRHVMPLYIERLSIAHLCYAALIFGGVSVCSDLPGFSADCLPAVGAGRDAAFSMASCSA